MAQLDEATGRRLISFARAAIERHILGDSTRNDADPWPTLPKCGVFVTLRRHGVLRGCIGTFSDSDDLLKTVAEIAVGATRDPRFQSTPISASELPEIRIELSVLSERERIEDPLDFELGRHGVYIKNGYAVGCFLPGVGQDLGWTREQFLSELCRQKAGLSPDAWQDPKTEVYVFTVQKIQE